MIPTNVKQIMQRLIDHKFEAYIIGGACRDIFLGVEPKDYDIFTNATGEEILKLFPCGKVIGNEERQSKILTVIVDGVEVSQYRSSGDRTIVGNSLANHLTTCDFTCNTLFMGIDEVIHDLEYLRHRGTVDLANNTLRFVGDPCGRIVEDPLRILRAVRFSLKYNLFITDQSALGIKVSLPKMLECISLERIHDEIIKIFELDDALSLLSDLCIFKYLFPEFLKTNNVNGGPNHNENVNVHGIKSFEICDSLSSNPLLKLAVLFHDIGKPDCLTEKDGIHFYGHDKVGAKIVEGILTKYKFAKNEIEFVTTLIRLHMFGYKTNDANRNYTKLFCELESNGIDILDYMILLYSDNQGNLKKPRVKFGDFLANNIIYKKWIELKEKKIPFKISDLEINGNDVMECYNIKSGKAVGDILRDVFDLVNDGIIANKRSDLMNYLKTSESSIKELE